MHFAPMPHIPHLHPSPPCSPGVPPVPTEGAAINPEHPTIKQRPLHQNSLISILSSTSVCPPKAEPCCCARTHCQLSLHARCTHAHCAAHTLHTAHCTRCCTHVARTLRTLYAHRTHAARTLHAYCTHAARTPLVYPHIPSLHSTNQELLLGRLQLERRHSAAQPRLYPGRTAASSQSH